MLSLFTIWSLALSIVIAIIIFALLRMKQNKLVGSGAHVPSEFAEFFGDQLHDMFTHTSKVLRYMKPHAAQVGMTAFSFSKRGHDLFVERVFGRMEFKRGNAGSFFLKHIAEHKKQGQKREI